MADDDLGSDFYHHLPADLLAALRVERDPLPGEEQVYERVVSWTLSTPSREAQ